MRKFDIEKNFHNALKKLFKKDRVKYNRIWNKINEIINISDVEHYKNLRAPLQNFKSVHIEKSFVLIFKYDKANDKVIFYDFDHHDIIYKKRFL